MYSQPNQENEKKKIEEEKLEDSVFEVKAVVVLREYNAYLTRSQECEWTAGSLQYPDGHRLFSVSQDYKLIRLLKVFPIAFRRKTSVNISHQCWTERLTEISSSCSWTRVDT